MPQYTVALPPEQGGGYVTVNASDPGAARENAGVGGNATVLAGGHAAHQESGYAVGGYAPGTGPSGTTTSSTGTAPDGSWIEKWLQMIASGNDRAFFESVRQYNLEHGLDVDKFNQAVRQFNENLAISQAGLTGVYQGQPTMQAQEQAYKQQLGAITTAAGLQASPFRQAQVIGQLGGLLGGRGVAGFQAPNVVQGVGTAGGNLRGGMGYLQQLIDDIRDPTANQKAANDILAQIPTPNKLDSTSFLRASPLTQSMVLQGMQEKYGLDPNDALAQIRNTLPQFRAPTTMGAIQR
jgi:hypothetical protein